MVKMLMKDALCYCTYFEQNSRISVLRHTVICAHKKVKQRTSGEPLRRDSRICISKTCKCMLVLHQKNMLSLRPLITGKANGKIQARMRCCTSGAEVLDAKKRCAFPVPMSSRYSRVVHLEAGRKVVADGL